MSSADVYSENGYLVFRGIEEVDSVIQLFSTMSTAEKLSWEKSYDWVSARGEFDKIFDEYEKLNSREEFSLFKNKYFETLSFNERDENDCSIDYPFATNYFLPVINKEGLVKIGESLIKYTKTDHIVIRDGDINVLNNLSSNMENGNVFIFPKLKSVYSDDALIHDFPEDNPFGSANRWHEKTTNRRLNNELRIDRFRYYDYNYQTQRYEWVLGYRIYFKQRAQKKSWGSWVDYKTRYTFDDLYVKVASEPISTYDPYTPPVSAEVSPSASITLYGYVYRFPYNEFIVPELIPEPLTSLSILTSCQGFDGILYRVDHVEHSGFPGSGTPFYPGY